MNIAIVGAGIAGLTAGSILAKNGHQVVVLEKSRGFGGRLATRYSDHDKTNKFDHGSPSLTPESPEFKSFVKELEDNGIVKPWTDSFSFYNDEGFFEVHPGRDTKQHFCAPAGLNSLGKYLSRWVDVRTETQVAGITMVAPDSKRKRPWILNMADASVLEADAIIIATPAIQASGILQTAQDETPIRLLHAQVSKVQYNSCFTLMIDYGDVPVPDWKGIVCQHDVIRFISNENTKRDNATLTLVAHANTDFSFLNRESDKQSVAKLMLEAVAQITDGNLGPVNWHQLHFWRYYQAVNHLNKPFLEISEGNPPLAIIGDYMGGNSYEAAYVSGKALAEHWLQKLK
jgi:predicted NAD/FAD-dependent oxidoreductase